MYTHTDTEYYLPLYKIQFTAETIHHLNNYNIKEISFLVQTRGS